mgnify:CR=1 FL=1
MNFKELYNNEIKKNLMEETSAIKKQMNTVTTVILIFSVIVMVSMSLAISKNINKNVHSFRQILEEISNGNLIAKTEFTTKDEFSIFGNLLNEFIKKMNGVITNVIDLSNEVQVEIQNLSTTINLVVEGDATTNTSGILQIQEKFGKIVDSVNVQSSNTEESQASILNISNDTSQIFSHISDIYYQSV